jgi:hypothetical protein
MIDVQQATSGTGATIDADALLQASRRVDWRFLLPDPTLGQVAYIGPARGAHPESLRLFSAALTLLDTPAAPAARAQHYDVVVLNAPSREALRGAAKLAKPGGFLYIEAKGLLWPKHWRPGRSSAGSPRLRHAANYIAALGQLGFGECSAHWHWPNFEACTRIIPLDDSAALIHAFQRERNGMAARLQTALGAALVRSGLLARIVPSFSVVARRLH